MATIPESHRHLFEEKVFAMLGTVMPDGQPQVHPVWVDYDGEYVRVNTQRGRQKDDNMQRHPQATVLLIDTTNAYFWMEVRGEVAERIEGEKAEAHIDALSFKYTGRESYANRTAATRRVLYKLRPVRVVTGG